jgi:hypothetical protein
MAIKYFDRILTSVDVQKKRLQLVGICCLLLAAKHEEQEELVPSMEALNHLANNGYSERLINEMVRVCV